MNNRTRTRARGSRIPAWLARVLIASALVAAGFFLTTSREDRAVAPTPDVTAEAQAGETPTLALEQVEALTLTAAAPPVTAEAQAGETPTLALEQVEALTLTAAAPTPTPRPPTATRRPTATATVTPTPTATATACVPRADWREVYTLQRGDTLAGIARRVELTANALAAGNCIPDPDRVQAGLELRVPQQPVFFNTLTPSATDAATRAPRRVTATPSPTLTPTRASRG